MDNCQKGVMQRNDQLLCILGTIATHTNLSKPYDDSKKIDKICFFLLKERHNGKIS